MTATERTLDRQSAEWDLFPVALVLGVVMLLILTLDFGEERADPGHDGPTPAPVEKTESL